MGEQSPILGLGRRRSLDALIDALPRSLAILVAGSLVVALGAAFGRQFVALGTHPKAAHADFIGCFAAWDGEHYAAIARNGYSYDPKRPSNIAFFPAYPLTGRFVSAVTGMSEEESLLLLAYAFLLCAYAVAAVYVEERFSGSGGAGAAGESSAPERAGGLANFVLLALAFFPTTFYFRMTYTESLFLLEVVLMLYGMSRRWPLWALAALVGLATATRGPGIALLGPLLWHLWRRCASGIEFVGKSALVLPAACWGLLAFMAYQYAAFDDPIAFARTQSHWDERPPVPLIEKLWLELTLEPFFCEFDPACNCNLNHNESHIFSMYSANPVFFLIFAGLVAWGAFKGWLNREEAITGAALLAFTYFVKSYATCMCSQARFASTAFPAYLVMGQLLRRLPPWTVGLILGVCGFFLGAYSALFVRWHNLY